MSIRKTIAQPGHPSYYSERWMTTIEKHISYLQSHPETSLVDVSQNAARAAAPDFYALLTQQAIEPRWHWAIMRVNGFENPMQLTGEEMEILVPSEAVLHALFIQTVAR